MMGFWMLRIEEEESERKLPDILLIKKILIFLKPHARSLYISIGTILLGTATAIAGPYVLSQVVNSAIYDKNLDALMFFSWIYLLIHISDWIIGSIRSYVISAMADRTLRDIRRKMYENLQRLSMDYYSKRQVGWLFSRVMSDVNVVNNMLSSGLLSSIGDIFLILVMIITMFILSPWMTIVSMSVMPLVGFFSWIFAKKARIRFREARRKIAQLTSEVQQSVSGIRVIKAFSEEENWQRRFERANLEYAQAEMSAAALISGFRPIAELLETIDISLILAFGAYEVLSGRLLVGTLLAFINYAMRLFWPIREIAFLYNNLQETLAASERIVEVIETKPTVEEDKEAIEVPVEIERIDFENVSFEYEKGLEVLKNINLTIKRNERIAIVGPTGAGKSTLSSLIIRFYDPTKGRILINGIDIRKIKIGSLRRKIVVVPQEPFLFSGTVMDNLRYGRPDATDEEIRQAISQLGMESFIDSLEKGYETEVMEGGIGLSIGQRQLICIARAFITDPSVVILDEAMSSVDPNTEQRVRSVMNKLMRNRTALIIAHRISTIVDADRIIVMDGGRIVEEGTHSQLLRLQGLYSKLYETLIGPQEDIIRAPAK